MLKLAKPPCKAGLGSSFVILFASVLLAIFLLKESPRGIPHPDALIFTQLCQSAIGTVERWQDYPGGLGRAVHDCSQYDWNRGRITNYLAFLLGGLLRPQLSTGFFDPLALALMALNAWLAVAVLRKNSPQQPILVEIFSAALFCFTPFTLVGIQVQFIYAKYLCMTFVLGALLSSGLPLKMFCLLLGVFSDEIGLLFGMLYGGVLLADRFRVLSWAATLLSMMRLCCVALWSVFVWFLYHLILQIFFGRLPNLMKKSKLLPGWEQVCDALFYPIKTLFWGWGLIALDPPDAGAGASRLAGLPWCIWFTPILVMAMACLIYILAPLPRRSLSRETLRDLVCLLITLGVVNFVFYKGTTGDFGYYGYPLFIGITLSLLIWLNQHTPRAAVVLSFLLAATTFLSIPLTSRGIRLRIGRELLSGTISIERLANLENQILTTGHHKPLPEAFISGQELAITTENRFNEKYFPVKGIARIFLWPRPLPGPPPAFQLEP